MKMNPDTAEKLLHLHRLSLNNEKYMEMLEQFQKLDHPMKNLLFRLSEDDFDLFAEYVGLLVGMSDLLLQIACEKMDMKKDS